ncbi:MAG: PAS domain S-box protein [Ferruginibacter sp.]
MKRITSDSELGCFFEMSPDLVCIAGSDGNLKEVNPVFCAKLGFSDQELKAQPLYNLIHPDDRELTRNACKNLPQGKVFHDLRNRYLCKSGDIIWLEWTCMYIPENGNILAIGRDVTQKVAEEKELEAKYRKFERLTKHFKGRLEKDRKLFAYEIHEDLAQLSAAVKMDIDWLETNISCLTDAARIRIRNASKVTGLLIKTLQRVAFMASPNMLDDFGLSTTLDFFCSDFTRIYGIPVRFNGNCNEAALEPSLKIDFFRICQEVLTGMADLSKASAITVTLREEADSIHLIVADESDSLTVINAVQQVAWENIRRRVESISGTIAISTQQGSEVEITVACKTIAGWMTEAC